MKKTIFALAIVLFCLGHAYADDIDLDGHKVKKGSVEHVNFREDAYNVQSKLCFEKASPTICRGARLLALRDESSQRRLANDFLTRLRKACADGKTFFCKQQKEFEQVFGMSASDPEIKN